MGSAAVAAAAAAAAVQEWVERYKANRAAAAAELMTLLVKVGAGYCLWLVGLVAQYMGCCSI
jgi:hypothetical protein